MHTEVDEVCWLGSTIGLWSEIMVDAWIPRNKDEEVRAKGVRSLDGLG